MKDCSIVISKTLPAINNQLNKSSFRINQNSLIDSEVSVESSTPSGASKIVKFIGDEWQNISSVSPKNVSSNVEQIKNSNKIINNMQDSHSNSLERNIESNITEDTVSKNDTDNTLGASSNYIPSSINEINCTAEQICNENMSTNLNFSNNDAPPVDIRDVYVPVFKKRKYGLFT